MVLYKCLYCDKTFYHKTFYKKHEAYCLTKFNLIIEKYKSYNKVDLMSDFFNCNKKKQHNYKCDKCDKIYTSLNGLKKHKLKLCQSIIPSNIINNNDNKNITNIQGNQINASNIQNNSNNTNTQNNITNNISNNIKLIPYDDIKYDYMKESVLLQAFEVPRRVNLFKDQALNKCPGEAFQSITTDTFFNPDNKENHVIYCPLRSFIKNANIFNKGPNLNNSQIHVYNGNKFSSDGWEVCLPKQTNLPCRDIVNKKKFFREMIKRQMNTLEKIFKCNEEDDNILELENITGFKNLLKEYNANDEVIKEYTEILNTLCYKNNHIVKDAVIVKK